MLSAGLSMLLVGYAGGIPTLQEISLPLTIGGMVASIFGIHLFKVLWFPIAYLFLMIPVWEEILTGHFHLYLQRFSAQNGVALLDLVGIPVHLEGLYIRLPNIVLEVARACSGVNHLIAVVAIGIPLAYLFIQGWKRRIILVGAAVLIAIFANGLRVALIALFAYFNLGTPLHGPFHILQGLFVSAIGYVVLFLCTWILSTKRPPPSKPNGEKETTSLAPSVSSANNKLSYPLIVISVLLLAIGSYTYLNIVSPYPLRKNINLFPTHIDEWAGEDISRPLFNVFKDSGVDHELKRTYKANSGDEIQLYVGYFEYQDQKKKIINYKTAEFHRNASKTRININANHQIEINKAVYRNKNKFELILFWYDLNRHIASERYMAKLYTICDALVNRRTNGAVIIIKSELDDIETLPGKMLKVEGFIKTIYPVLGDYLPK
jgi:EpsI family protein